METRSGNYDVARSLWERGLKASPLHGPLWQVSFVFSLGVCTRRWLSGALLLLLLLSSDRACRRTTSRIHNMISPAELPRWRDVMPLNHMDESHGAEPTPDTTC